MSIRDDYALTRAVFINSLSPGCINEIQVLGNTALTGANGNGKTSYLRCLPLFYGEEPRRIVPSSPNLKSFYEYYLPHPNSFIVFEYRRAGGEMRCVFIYTNTDESNPRPHYRFVRRGFDLSLVIADGQRVVTGRELERHWHSVGANGSPQLESTADYRRIILADLSDAGANSKRLKPLMQDYSCASPGRSLAGIDTIVQSMFKRQADFEDLRELVVKSVIPANQDATLRLQVPVATLEAWPARTRAYQKAMLAMDDTLAASKAEGEVQVHNARLSDLRGQAQRLARHFDDEAVRAAARVKQQVEQRVAQGEEVEEALGELEGRIRNAKGEAASLSGEISGIRQRGESLKEQRAPEFAALADNEAHLLDSKRALEGERSALVTGSQAIEAEYNRLIEEPTHRKDRADGERQRVLAEIEREDRSKAEAADRLLREKEASLSDGFKPRRDALVQAVSEAARALGEAQAMARRPAADESLVQAYETKRDAHSAAAESLEAARQTHRAAEGVANSARRAYEAAEDRQQRAQRKVKEATDARRAAEAAAQPHPQSLQSFLDAEMPEWGRDIGKVIAPDLLARTDLKPQLADGEGAPRSLFGVNLRVDALPEGISADREARLKALEKADDALHAAEAERATAAAVRDEAAKARTAADKDEVLAGAAVGVAQRKHQQTKEEADQASRLVQESRAKAADLAKSRLTEAQNAKARADKAITDADQEHAAAVHGARKERDSRIEAIKEQAEARRTAENAAWRALAEALDAEVAALHERRAAALRASGVDTESLKAIEVRLREVAEALDKIARARQIVADWRAWLETASPRLPELEQRRRQAEERGQALEKEHKAHRDAWKERERSMRQHEEDEREKAREAEDQANRCRALAETIANVLPPNAPPSVEPESVDSVWTHEYLSSQAMAAKREREGWQKEVELRLGRVRTQFNAEPGTPPHQYLLQAQGPDQKETLKQLLAWFVDSEAAEAVHKQHLSLLITEAGQIGSLIEQFHTSLDGFHRDILGFNRELQDSLDRNCQFRAIKKLQFRVESEVKALDFWPLIERLVEAFRTWQGEARDKLPGAEFAATLSRLLEHAELRKGLEAERSKLIRLEGTIEDKGEERRFTTGQQLKDVSSNGLSYLVLISLFLAFIHRIRGPSQVNVAWSLDELLALDAANVQRLLELLTDNHVTLVCAFPDPNPETLSLFRNRYLIDEDKRPGEARLADSEMAREIEALGTVAPEVEHV